ncbi:MAG: hypothetical protein KQ78_00403 [Candidatus Izimaplasma bacterium HR2]|nr:MAG: hypothetical protein KQ78_00403 [Candidatus Izimaplasma bacterium HR2]
MNKLLVMTMTYNVSKNRFFCVDLPSRMNRY